MAYFLDFASELWNKHLLGISLPNLVLIFFEKQLLKNEKGRRLVISALVQSSRSDEMGLN
jgi:hypothetical protein